MDGNYVFRQVTRLVGLPVLYLAWWGIGPSKPEGGMSALFAFGNAHTVSHEVLTVALFLGVILIDALLLPKAFELPQRFDRGYWLHFALAAIAVPATVNQVSSFI